MSSPHGWTDLIPDEVLLTIFRRLQRELSENVDNAPQINDESSTVFDNQRLDICNFCPTKLCATQSLLTALNHCKTHNIQHLELDLQRICHLDLTQLQAVDAGVFDSIHRLQMLATVLDPGKNNDGGAGASAQRRNLAFADFIGAFWNLKELSIAFPLFLPAEIQKTMSSLEEKGIRSQNGTGSIGSIPLMEDHLVFVKLRTRFLDRSLFNVGTFFLNQIASCLTHLQLEQVQLTSISFQRLCHYQFQQLEGLILKGRYPKLSYDALLGGIAQLGTIEELGLVELVLARDRALDSTIVILIGQKCKALRALRLDGVAISMEAFQSLGANAESIQLYVLQNCFYQPQHLQLLQSSAASSSVSKSKDRSIFADSNSTKNATNNFSNCRLRFFENSLLKNEAEKNRHLESLLREFWLLRMFHKEHSFARRLVHVMEKICGDQLTL